MSTPITPLWPKKTRGRQLFICFCFALLSLFPLFASYYYGNGYLTYSRHKDLMAGQSSFFNPWQYRILSPYMVEGAMWVYNHTIDKVIPIPNELHFTIKNTSGPNEKRDTFLDLVSNPDALKYFIIFSLFRFIQHFFIFYLCWRLWGAFVKSKWLIFLGLSFVSIAMGNTSDVADLSLNTYTDIILYLLTANLIIHKWSPKWLFLITPLAAFNRETGLLIPFLYFISATDFTNFSFMRLNIKEIKFPKLKTWVFVGILYVIFFSIFAGLRIYYGYPPQQEWRVPAGLPMLKLNLLSPTGFKAYMALLGTFGVIPFIILYRFKAFPHILKVWFIGIVPIWFAVHYITVVAYQTRLFLVPIIMIFITMMLWLIEQEIVQRYKGIKNEV
ncbi:MAG: hypothetical protein J5I50_12755 [Chitinophagaceae bacterium]|nr:hypothetical protein [Chitinophagaceae bacterium]